MRASAASARGGRVAEHQHLVEVRLHVLLERAAVRGLARATVTWRWSSSGASRTSNEVSTVSVEPGARSCRARAADQCPLVPADQQRAGGWSSSPDPVLRPTEVGTDRGASAFSVESSSATNDQTCDRRPGSPAQVQRRHAVRDHPDDRGLLEGQLRLGVRHRAEPVLLEEVDLVAAVVEQLGVDRRRTGLARGLHDQLGQPSRGCRARRSGRPRQAGRPPGWWVADLPRRSGDRRDQGGSGRAGS